MQTIAPAQIDPQKIDSLSRSIDSSRKTYQGWQDSLIKTHDSIKQSDLKETDFLTRNLPGAKAAKKKMRRWYGYLFVAIFFLIVLAAGVLYRSHRSAWYK